MGPKRGQGRSPRSRLSSGKARRATTPAAPPPLIFAIVAAYGILILLATLALSHRGPAGSAAIAPSPSVDPSLNVAGGDFVVTDGWDGCGIHVKLSATSKADGTAASGTIVMSAAPGQPWCKGQATGRITCLLVNGNFARLSGWLDDRSAMFTAGNVVQATLTENDPQPYGPPVDRAGFGVVAGSPECPPAIEGTGPQIMSGTLHVSPAGASKPGFQQPTPQPVPTPALWPNPAPNMDFASGDFVVVAGWNSCQIHVRLAATSKPDGTGAYGSVFMTAVPADHCQGEATGRVTCLLASGDSAMYSGWLDQATGMFSIGNVIQGSVTQNDPQAYGSPVDRAFLGLADGSPECPPALSGPGGPQIISGTLRVSVASPPA
ncbi:MAG: hypothetical protein E6I84_07555 [Chloroflexi bacterium]|nr:MAG: hypothetical protein E6I84_07555 [Chloroflexota bacterium]